MIVTYVLVVFLSTSVSTQVFLYPFFSEEACLRAREVILAQDTLTRGIVAECIKDEGRSL